MKNIKKGRINSLPMGEKVAYQCNCACPRTTPVEVNDRINTNKSTKISNYSVSHTDDTYSISVSSE